MIVSTTTYASETVRSTGSSSIGYSRQGTLTKTFEPQSGMLLNQIIHHEEIRPIDDQPEVAIVYSHEQQPPKVSHAITTPNPLYTSQRSHMVSFLKVNKLLEYTKNFVTVEC